MSNNRNFRQFYQQRHIRENYRYIPGEHGEDGHWDANPQRDEYFPAPARVNNQGQRRNNGNGNNNGGAPSRSAANTIISMENSLHAIRFDVDENTRHIEGSINMLARVEANQLDLMATVDSMKRDLRSLRSVNSGLRRQNNRYVPWKKNNNGNATAKPQGQPKNAQPGKGKTAPKPSGGQNNRRKTYVPKKVPVQQNSPASPSASPLHTDPPPNA